MDKPSFKKYLLHTLHNEDELYDGADMVLLTASGVIIGKPISDTKIDNNFPVYVDDVHSNYVKEYNIVGDILPGNDGYMLLRDVTIKPPFGTTISLPFLTVFYDQIIGLFFGTLEYQ